MLQAANTDLFNPLVSKAYNSECQNQMFPLEIKPVEVSCSHFVDFYLCTSGTNGLKLQNREPINLIRMI